MMTYEDAWKEVKSIVAEQRPENVENNLKNMREVLASSLANPEPEFVQIPSWPYFSKTLGGGLRMNEFSVLCGPTGAGKTTLLANLACQLIANHTPIFVASVEVKAEKFVEKMISIVTGKKKQDQSVNPVETLSQMGKAFNTTDCVFTTYDSRVPHLQLLCDLYYAHKTHGTQVALIDNLNFLMEVGDQRNAITSMDKAVHEFVVFCKKIPMHVIMVMHPRKTEGGRIESEFDIKGSSTAVQEASNVILFNKIKTMGTLPEDCNPQFSRELKFAKIRDNGGFAGTRIILKINPETEMYKEARIL